MNADISAKQQIVEKIKSSSNILVTVSTDPTVDELSAALALTMLLNKLKKHATAVVSGAIPPAITFLEPDKTFENTVDSLRDFIIALDKEKADHLRYKVDGDVVKIFITPYRTTITDQDLDFSQGDYNVELVIALGVKNRDHLDAALVAHGRILHDATVVTIGNGEASKLGSIDWQDSGASSLSEMLISLTESLKEDKSVLDEQIATALLTGIVAATDRFSNNLTSSRVMTMAAQLMAAGANQQLIAAKLEEANEIGSGTPQRNTEATPAVQPDDDANRDGTTDLEEGESTKFDKNTPPTLPKSPKSNDGDLAIEHEQPDEPASAEQPEEDDMPSQESAPDAENELSSHLTAATPVSTISVADLQADLANASAELDQAALENPSVKSPVDVPDLGYEELPAPAPSAVPKTSAASGADFTSEPTMGGTLNATTEEAADQKRKEAESDRNRTILTHDSHRYIADDPSAQAPINGAAANDEKPLIDVFGAPAGGFAPNAAPPNIVGPSIEPLFGMPDANDHFESKTLEEIDSQNRTQKSPDDARAAVEDAFNAAPFNPANNPEEAIGAQPFGEVPHNDAPQPVGAVPFSPSQPMPPLPPMPDFSTLPPLPPQPGLDQASLNQQNSPTQNVGDIFNTGDQTPPPAAPPSGPSDPGQFKIPGQ